MAEIATVAPNAPPLAGTSKHSSVVAVYDTHAEAEKAIRALATSGFDMKQLSIIGRDYSTEEGVVGYYNAGDRMMAWGKTGAFWGGIWGMIFGSALFVIPGVGPLFAAGPIVAWIAGALESAAVVGGLGAIGAGLVSIGIPRDSVLNYETQIKAGKFVVIAHGAQAAVAKSEAILQGARQHEGKSQNCCA
ncbi:MAG TPA: general stress protein [Vicinamibacterales bacterium]|nr:general stress protein [Vicinamibacterales bacterium]